MVIVVWKDFQVIVLYSCMTWFFLARLILVLYAGAEAMDAFTEVKSGRRQQFVGCSNPFKFSIYFTSTELQIWSSEGILVWLAQQSAPFLGTVMLFPDGIAPRRENIIQFLLPFQVCTKIVHAPNR